MGDLLNMSLDAIISQNKSTKPKPAPPAKAKKKTKTGGVGPAKSKGAKKRAERQQAPYKKPSAPPARKSAGNNNTKNNKPQQKSLGTKIMISNLQRDVLIGDILELYSEVGNVKSAELHYTNNGKPKGSAEVVFVRRDDALAAIKKYNRRELDGVPMRVNMMGNVAPKNEPPSQKQGGGVTFQVTLGGGRRSSGMLQSEMRDRNSRRGRDDRDSRRGRDAHDRRGGARDDRDRRGGGRDNRDRRGGRDGRDRRGGKDEQQDRRGGDRRANNDKRRDSKPPAKVKKAAPTAEDLDAEMAEYMKSRN